MNILIFKGPFSPPVKHNNILYIFTHYHKHNQYLLTEKTFIHPLHRTKTYFFTRRFKQPQHIHLTITRLSEHSTSTACQFSLGFPTKLHHWIANVGKAIWKTIPQCLPTLGLLLLDCFRLLCVNQPCCKSLPTATKSLHKNLPYKG